jgi:CheY-like chemotaxis protein
MSPSDAVWNLLVVDDDADVRQVTELALKRFQWRGKSFRVSHADGAAAAQALLANPRLSPPHAAIVDVVMESDHAGLELCRFIRSNCPRSLRIILRTGQPGMAPEQAVMNEFDIDYYLEKGESSSEKLYATIRACIHASQEISTLLEMSGQLEEFISAFKVAGSLDDLIPIMSKRLQFLQDKYGVQMAFVYGELRLGDTAPRWNTATWSMTGTLQRRDMEVALTQAWGRDLDPSNLYAATEFGLPAGDFLMLNKAFNTVRYASEDHHASNNWLNRLVKGTHRTEEGSSWSAVIVRFPSETITERERLDFASDVLLFIRNWHMAAMVISSRDRVIQQRVSGELSSMLGRW